MKSRRLLIVTAFGISLVTLLYFGLTSKKIQTIVDPDLGVLIEKNDNRLLNSIPIIEKGWILIESDTSHQYWSNQKRSVLDEKPAHLYKIIYLSRGMVVSERDAFHFEGLRDKAYRLIIDNYLIGHSEDSNKGKFITYFKGTSRDAEIKIISRYQADSVLTAWRIVK